MRPNESNRPRTECENRHSRRRLLLAKAISKEVDMQTNERIKNDLSVKDFDYNEESIVRRVPLFIFKYWILYYILEKYQKIIFSRNDIIW